MSDIVFSIKPREFLDKISAKYKVNGYWLGFYLCPFCGGGDHGLDKWTFAVHSIDGNYNCLREKCDAKGSFWGLIQYFGHDPKQYLAKGGIAPKRFTKKGKPKRFVYGKR